MEIRLSEKELFVLFSIEFKKKLMRVRCLFSEVFLNYLTNLRARMYCEFGLPVEFSPYTIQHVYKIKIIRVKKIIHIPGIKYEVRIKCNAKK